MSILFGRKAACLFPVLFLIHVFANGQVMTNPEQTISARIVEQGDNIVLKLTKQAVSISCQLGLNTDLRVDLFKPPVQLNTNGISETAFHDPFQTKPTTKQWKGYHLIGPNGEKIEFRIFDKAVAFRYVYKGDESVHVHQELTQFGLPENTKVWFFERNNHWKLKSHAGEWMSCDIEELPAVSSQGPIQGTPLIFEFSNGTFGFISEAALMNYSGMRLKAQAGNRMSVNFTEGEDGFEVEGTLQSPWRVLFFADDLNELVNQKIIQALAPAPDQDLFAETDWIKPGKAVWRFWAKGTGSSQEEKRMIEFARELGFEYSLVDAGWEKWPDKWSRLKELCDFAGQFNIGIWAWKHSRDLGDPKNDYQQMEFFLDSLARIGVKGIKIDFMNSEARPLIDFEVKALETAARHKLMVNFHGCQKPAGESHTFPNELTREGIRGLELNTMKEGPLPAWHNAALPFTRLVVGPGDYTPLGFSAPGPTTWAHQLATLICFYSPLQCVAEDPEFLLTDLRVKPALDFIRTVPVIWDETLVLAPSEIGKQTVMARRKENTWYIGILNGTGEQKINLNLDFLDGKKYNATCFFDDKESALIHLENLNPKAQLKEYKKAVPFNRVDQIVRKSQEIEIDLAQGGGAVIQLSPVGEIKYEPTR